MQSIQEIISDDQIKRKFTELRQELGDKLRRYTVDELCEIYYELYKNGYIINGFLGSGTEGPVFSVININDGNQIAVKVISGSDASQIDNELKIMKKFQNQPYIHQYLSSFYSKNNKYFFYLTEKLTCDLEHIMSVMEDRQQKFSYNQIIAFAVQMSTALQILESNKIIHSDLKPANILYDNNSKCFKISDYGFSRIIQQKFSQQMRSATQSIKGCTPKFAAPEIIQQSRDYTCKVDIYSLGLILLELVQGSELDLLQAMQILGGGAENISRYLENNKQYESLNTIIQSMLVVNRNDRISASKLLQELQSLQSKEESKLYRYLQTRVDNTTLQNINELYSFSLTQINIDYIKDTTKQIRFNQPLKKEVNQIKSGQPQLQYYPYKLNNYFSDASGYQQPSYAQPIQQQLVAQNKYSQQQQQFNQQQIIQPILKKQHKQLKFKEWIESTKQLIEVEEALAKYQNDFNTSLDIKVRILGYARYNKVNELTDLGASVVTSRLASGLEKCSASINSLSLQFNYLKMGPEGMKSISQSIGMMHQNLTTLSLIFSWLEIGPEGASSLATAIEKCSKNLLALGLLFCECGIDSDQIKYISQSLEKCDKMTTLGLHLANSSRKIGPTGASYLASSLPECKSLTELTLILWDQDISNEGLQSLGSGLEKCEKLTGLNVRIYDRRINEQSIEEFGSSLVRGCPNLITLGVQFRQYKNNKSTYSTYTITPSLTLCKLTTLTLFLWKNDADNISTLKTNLKKCQNLTSLCLCLQNGDGSNQWASGRTSSLVESLEKSNLTTLKLVFYDFKFGEQSKQWQQANRLGESLSKFKKLTSLYLFFQYNDDNPTQFISTLLSNHLAQNKNITALSLGACGPYYDSGKLTSSDAQMIGESLEKCKYLQTLHLYLWNNKIKSEGALAISQSLQKCVHLTALELSIIESYCCDNDWKHKHIYQMDSVSSTIRNDLKEKCKKLGELKVKVSSDERGDDFYRKMLIKLGILTRFESNFWGS